MSKWTRQAVFVCDNYARGDFSFSMTAVNQLMQINLHSTHVYFFGIYIDGAY